MEAIRILIADDHQIVRQGLTMIIASESDYEIIGEANDGIETVRAVSRFKPQIIPMDLSMPTMNGLEATMEIKALHPETKILVLTVHDSEEHIPPTPPRKVFWSSISRLQGDQITLASEYGNDLIIK